MEDAAAIQPGGTMGSPQWTAPEVLKGAAYGAPADAYSYVLLNGEHVPPPPAG